MNNRWSASRFSCFLDCKNKHNLQYIKELIVLGKINELATKGLSFHQIAEQMDSSKSLEDLIKIAEADLATRNFDKEKYPVIKAIPRFYFFWKEFIEPKLNDGFTLKKEEWLYGSISRKSIVGAIDLLLVKEETGEVIVIDYKTGATPKVDSYKNQLLLYAYMMKNQIKTSYDKIKTYLFFPLAALKDEDGTEETARKLMLKTLKELIFDKSQVEEVIDSFKNIIKESDKTDWDNFDMKENANISFGCNWCDFCGHPTYCQKSYEQGMRFSRKCKIMTKAEAKALQEEKISSN